MKWLKSFNNPFVLGLHGFVAGALLFFATHPGAAGSLSGNAPASEQHVQDRQDA